MGFSHIYLVDSLLFWDDQYISVLQSFSQEDSKSVFSFIYSFIFNNYLFIYLFKFGKEFLQIYVDI